MQFRSLGRTGTQVSALCLGCMNFGGKTGEADSVAIIDRALDAGINFLDTANVYSGGASEEVTGKALKRGGKRERVVLATKFHGNMDPDDPNAWGNHRRHLIEQCEASLRRLQTDWIDLYQVHRPQPDIPIDETLRALDDLVRAGKVRYLGTSTYAAWQLMESLWVARELGLNRFVCEQPPYHLLDRSIELELIPMAQTYGFAIIPWSPLAGGFLTGKYRRGQSAPEDSRYAGELAREDRIGERARDIFGQGYPVLEIVEKLAGEKGCTVSQFALGWVAQQPGVTSPIIGPRTMEQLEDNLGAVDVKLTAEDQARIDAVSPPKRAVVPYYGPWAGGDFGPHLHRW